MTIVYDFFYDQEEAQWLDTLPIYQKEIMDELLAGKSHEEAAEAWLEATFDNTSPFSGQIHSDRKFFSLLKDEVHKLLCGNPDYNFERSKLSQLTQTPENKTAIVSTVSAIIGAKVGLAATFLAPAIVLIFIMIAKVSLNAWCAMTHKEPGMGAPQ